MNPVKNINNSTKRVVRTCDWPGNEDQHDQPDQRETKALDTIHGYQSFNTKKEKIIMMIKNGLEIIFVVIMSNDETDCRI